MLTADTITDEQIVERLTQQVEALRSRHATLALSLAAKKESQP